VVQGRVVDRGTGDAIVGASIDLLGVAHIVTGENGAFRFPRVALGRHTLDIDMIGYQTRRIDLPLLGDTTLIIELDSDPIRMDTLDVRTRRVTIRGRVVDGETGVGLFDADVFASGDRSTRTNSAGGFRLRGVPTGQPVGVLVRVLGFLPGQTEFIIDNDTTLHFALEPDRVAQRMIAAQVMKLETRSNAVGFSKSEIARVELLRKANWAVDDVVKTQLGIYAGRVQCVLIDDQLRPDGMAMLQTYLPDQLERIEIIDRGAMIRVYTRDFIQRMMGNRVTLAPIVLIRTPGGIICR